MGVEEVSMVDTYLVTGGAGFIGSHLVDRLVSDGARVRVLDNLSTGDINNLAASIDSVEFISGDLRNSTDIDKSMVGVDVVVHLGALGSVPRSIDDPTTTHDVNATGTLNALVSARDHQVRRFIYASSSSVYGDNPSLPKREGHEGQVLSPYAMTKAMGEEYCRLFHELYSLETIRLRFFNVFGPRQKANHLYAAAIPKFIDWAKRHEPIVVHGDGTQSRDFTYIDNNIAGIVAAATSSNGSIAGRAFNLACGRGRTLLEILSEIEALNGAPLLLEHGPNRPGDVTHSYASIDALNEVTGYKPTVSVIEGIRRTWAAYVDEREVNTYAF